MLTQCANTATNTIFRRKPVTKECVFWGFEVAHQHIKILLFKYFKLNLVFLMLIEHRLPELHVELWSQRNFSRIHLFAYQQHHCGGAVSSLHWGWVEMACQFPTELILGNPLWASVLIFCTCSPLSGNR